MEFEPDLIERVGAEVDRHGNIRVIAYYEDGDWDHLFVSAENVTHPQNLGDTRKQEGSIR